MVIKLFTLPSCPGFTISFANLLWSVKTDEYARVKGVTALQLSELQPANTDFTVYVLITHRENKITAIRMPAIWRSMERISS